jgi:hypothetical protein
MSNKQDGYIALMSVLILGAFTTAVAVLLLSTGVTSQQSTIISQRSAQARKLADGCTEEAFQILREQPAYTGTASISFKNGECTFVVSGETNPQKRTILSTGSIMGTVRRSEAHVTIRPLSISVTSIKEVP